MRKCKKCFGQQLRDRAKNVARFQGPFRKPNTTGCSEYVQLGGNIPPPLPISQVIFVFYGIDGKGVYTRVDVERTFRKFIEAIHFSLLRPQSLGATVVYI